MSFHVTCPHCNAILKAEETCSEKQAECPSCHDTFPLGDVNRPILLSLADGTPHIARHTLMPTWLCVLSVIGMILGIITLAHGMYSPYLEKADKPISCEAYSRPYVTPVTYASPVKFAGLLRTRN